MSPLALSLRFLQAQPDSRLVELARQGHEPAFEALVRRYRKELLSYCRRLQPQSGNAEDALQQTLLYAWRALNNGGQVRDVRPWLYRIAHNVSLNNLRVTVAVPQEILDTPGDQDVDRLVEQRLRARAALACMASLPALQRQAFISTVLDGASHDDVATALGLSNGAVRGLIYRARAIVRAAAAAITPGPVISWAIQRAETGSGSAPAVAEAIAGGGGAGVAAVIAKGGAVLTLAVAGAGGVVLSHPGGHHGRARPQIARSSGLGQTASRPAASAHVAGGLPAEIGHGVNSGRTSDTTSRVATGRASARIREDNSRGERHGGSSGRTTGGHDGGARGESHGGRSSATSGSSDGGSTSGATIAVPGSGHGDGGSSGSSGGSDGGSGSDGTS
ncbi:MAG TPA: RNA polymerase sigma factor, partial [Solirubrobacteraceae bacterium]|nr:RNA polymerase sigma factor [Solirubrobacteraceae bacterium]